MNDNIIRPIFGAKATIAADWHGLQFFRDNPARRYHVRPATADDLSLPDEPERQPDQDDIIVMEKLLDPDSECGFSVQHWAYSVQGEVLDTDEDIGKLLEEMRRSRLTSKGLEPWQPKRPSVIYSSPGRSRQVTLTDAEISLLAWAIEDEARRHDKQQGSCPIDLHCAAERADALRKIAGAA